MPAVDQAPPPEPCECGQTHAVAPPPRTLPVTPAERACATVLRAYLGYEPEERDRAEEGGLRGMLDRVEQGGREAGLIEMWTTDATPAGAAILARVEAAERTPETVPMFYIQDTRSYVGNAVLWWRPDGAGYTTDIDDAGQYTEAEARRICRSRSTEKMIPAAVVRAATSRVVDADALFTALAGAAPIEAATEKP